MFYLNKIKIAKRDDVRKAMKIFDFENLGKTREILVHESNSGTGEGLNEGFDDLVHVILEDRNKAKSI